MIIRKKIIKTKYSELKKNLRFCLNTNSEEYFGKKIQTTATTNSLMMDTKNSQELKIPNSFEENLFLRNPTNSIMKSRRQTTTKNVMKIGINITQLKIGFRVSLVTFVYVCVCVYLPIDV